MADLFACPTFTGFGKSRLAPAQEQARLVGVSARRTSDLRAEVRRSCPRRPGVYGMIDLHGEVIYIGKAKNITLLTHKLG